MSQQVRIPKFGSWDAETVGYTTCFDSARKERASGVRMNPNDPEKNPEAFMSLKVDLDRQRAGRAGKPPPHTNSKPSVEIFQTASRNAPARPFSKSGTPQSFHSDSGSEKSLIQRNNTGSKIRKDASKVSYGFSQSSAVRTTLRSGNSVSQENHHVIATVPKFGSWDETDARSGDGFSIIFNKLKEEKHIGPASLRPPHPDHTSSSDAHCRHQNSLLSKVMKPEQASLLPLADPVGGAKGGGAKGGGAKGSSVPRTQM